MSIQKEKSKRAPVPASKPEEIRQRKHEHEMTSLLIKTVGIKWRHLERRACVYVAPKSSGKLGVRKIGQHIYHVKRGEKMGIKGKILGSYTTEECGPCPISKGSLYPRKLLSAIYVIFAQTLNLIPTFASSSISHSKRYLTLDVHGNQRHARKSSITILIWGV